MSLLSVKIIDVDIETNSILVKVVSEFSQNLIDEYEALSFNLANYNAATPDSFIEAIKPTLINYVKHRDFLESNPFNVNTTSWVGYTAELNVSKNQLIINLENTDPVLTAQMTPSMINPEVTI